MRVSDKKINRALKGQITKLLTDTISDIRNSEESEKFVSNFFTDSEIEVFSKRLAIAYWLKKRRSYENIKNNLRVSSATIAEISVLMQKDGFQLALEKIEAGEWANRWAEKINKFSKKLRIF